MTNPVFTPANELAKITAQTREKFASEVFHYQTIKELITEHAAKGFHRLRVSQEQTLDLSDTAPAQALCQKLEKRGYRTSWETCSITIKYKNTTSEFVEFAELVIIWGTGKGERYRSEESE